jgi:hypothetical protein
MLHTSKGTLKYHNEPYKLILEVDQGIGDFYRSLIPKYMPAKKPLYPTHVTVVRGGKDGLVIEYPIHLEFWGKYEGEEVEYHYDPIVQCGTVYYWLNVFCKRLEDIRVELGMSVNSPYTLPPEGFLKCFHMTIGNKK